ncbi:condensation domain-containing protein [Paractinoplanes hotanensis]|uniref:Condensation domain-containing protein n=1 Tax=Paractinoplanes hotanensis TaxID=2906497 RepID=A0ABT0Y5V2_9ACTN|nr:condensation domain-containing protein [Actinoplanes hotanensis]MCM4081419.1 condensation domain-containing protein [Actinoplanes hotanensis]
MPSLTTDVRRREVPFTGSRAITGQLTWGQVLVERDMRRMPPGTAYNVTVPVLIPAGVRTADVFAAVGALVGRYEALRTRFPRENGVLVQEVLAAGTVPVVVWSDDGPADEFAAGARKLDEQLEAAPFDHQRDLPLRVLVCVHRGVPRALVLCVSHLVADLQSSRLAARVLAELLTARAAGRPDPDPPAMVQPADLAAFERSDRGRALSAAAVAHLRRQLTAAPLDNFAGLAPVPAAEPRYWRGVVDSSISGSALGLMADRYRTSTATIALALTSALLGAVAGADRCGLLLVTGNRTTAAQRASVGTLTQHMPTVVDLTGPAFSDLVRHCWGAAMRAFRHGRFDPVDGWAAVDEVSRRRGAEPEIRCFFNDMRAGLEPAAAAEPPDRESVARELAEPRFRWTERRAAGSSFFMELGDVLDVPGRLRWTLLADTTLLPPETIRAVLTGVDRLLVRLLDTDLLLSDVAGAAGLPDRVAAAS